MKNLIYQLRLLAGECLMGLALAAMPQGMQRNFLTGLVIRYLDSGIRFGGCKP